MSASDHLSPTQFFHVTTEDAVPSIQKHGLDNTYATQELWSNVDDWDDGAYLWDNHEHAKSYASDLEKMGHKPTILRVRGEGLDVRPDTTGDQPVKGAWYARHVEPKRIAPL